MIITATFKEVKELLATLNYTDDDKVTIHIGGDSEEDTNLCQAFAVPEEEPNILPEVMGYTSSVELGSLPGPFVRQFRDRQDLLIIAQECLQEAAQYDWQKNSKTGTYYQLNRLNNTTLGKAIMKYTKVNGVPDWNTCNLHMAHFLDDNLNCVK